ncbi:MAG: VacJ family lipoprotein, partial [Nitrospirota bacterium]
MNKRLICGIIVSFAVVFSLASSSFADPSSPALASSLIERTAPSGQAVPEATGEREGVKAEEEIPEEEVLTIADPIRPWNVAMYHFNDKLYFWLLKPVAQGYSAVLPEDVRISASNFFKNLTTPIRFVSCLLQLRVKDAGNELFRFVYNSTAGVMGLADAARADFDVSRRDEDTGQALGSYGIGHGFYIVWPLIGPSSVRDTVGEVGDFFLDPVTYVDPT